MPSTRPEDPDGGYVHVAGRPNDQRRRRRATLVFGSLIAFLLLALVLAVWWGTRPAPTGSTGRPAPAASCTPTPAPRPAQITVNVYNATDRAGIAAGAATTLKGQGFTVAAVKNDPLGKKITGTAEVRHGPSGAGAAQVVAARVPSARIVADKRTDGSVDLVLGPDFTDVSSPLGGATPTPTC